MTIFDSSKFTWSYFAKKNIKARDFFNEENIRSIRPGYGLHPKLLKEVIGKVANKDLEKETPLQFEIFK